MTFWPAADVAAEAVDAEVVAAGAVVAGCLAAAVAVGSLAAVAVAIAVAVVAAIAEAQQAVLLRCRDHLRVRRVVQVAAGTHPLGPTMVICQLLVGGRAQAPAADPVLATSPVGRVAHVLARVLDQVLVLDQVPAHFPLVVADHRVVTCRTFSIYHRPEADTPVRAVRQLDQSTLVPVWVLES